MDLHGKKLLFLGGSGLDSCAIRRAKELGIYTIVANRYTAERAPGKKIADEAWMEDFSDVDRMVQLIRENRVDGIFVGWTDSHLPFYAEICKRAGLPCCGTKEQFGILSNDKTEFKKLCDHYGVPTVHEYKLDINFRKEDLAMIRYPVMVKPSDGSGSRGVKRCNNEQELKEHYTQLYNASENKHIICEEFIDTGKEIFLNYTIQDGYCSLSATYMCFDSELPNGKKGPAILHIYPSSYTKRFREEVEPKVLEMFRGIGLKNGILSLQGFVTDEGFKFHESGLRMGGGQSYVFTQKLNGVSALDLILEYAVTGQMRSVDLKTKDDPFFKKYGANYYISLCSGKIDNIEGYEKVAAMPQVLMISTFHKAGDVISADKSLDSVIYRMHVMDDTKEALARTLETISRTFRILDEDGEEMQTETLTYARAMERIERS